MISIVCVFNDKCLLERWLLKSLEEQNVQYQLILIDNSDSQFKSAAEALNYGGKKATGNYVMFVHQDVDMLSESFLCDLERMLDRIEGLGVAGVAGISESGRNRKERQKNIILEHEDPVMVWGNRINAPEPVQTLDECLIIVPRQVFCDHPFDVKVCDSWHFYSVDYCLSMKNLGLKTYAVPLKIHHHSMGFYVKFNSGIRSLKYLREFYRSLRNVIDKHKSDYLYIYTTNGDYCTHRNLYLQDAKRFLYRLMRGGNAE